MGNSLLMRSSIKMLLLQMRTVWIKSILISGKYFWIFHFHKSELRIEGWKLAFHAKELLSMDWSVSISAWFTVNKFAWRQFQFGDLRLLPRGCGEWWKSDCVLRAFSPAPPTRQQRERARGGERREEEQWMERDPQRSITSPQLGRWRFLLVCAQDSWAHQ